MLLLTFDCRPTGAGAVRTVLRVIASVVLLYACHVANAQAADPYVLSAGERGETKFWVVPNRLGILPTDAQAFDAVDEELTEIGNHVRMKNKDQQIIIADTISPKDDFDDIRAEASELMARIGEKVRWAGPIIVTGETAPGETPDIRDILLPTSVVIVKVREDVQPDAVLAIAEQIGLRLLYRHPADARKYYFESPPERKDINVITASIKLLDEKDIVDYAVPDTIIFVELRSSSLNDEFFEHQWPLDNTGQNGGMVDADIDADLAWSEFGLGKPCTIIAVLDDGFDMTHPDLAPNLFVNVEEEFGEISVDDDGNGYVDDRHGWDFSSDCWGTTSHYCGDPNPAGSGDPDGRHGTMTSGAAAARGNNTRGVSGSCPHCTLLPVKIGLWSPRREQALAFDYARAAGADVITNSWGYRLQGLVALEVVDAINRAHEAGSAIFFAMSSTGLGGYQNDCANDDISSLENVIAVSASNNVDTRTPAGYGACMAALAPTDNEGANAGTLWPVSTDMADTAGYNDHDQGQIPSCAPTDIEPPPMDARWYTLCANGTSYATPLTAGIAGLMESVDSALSPERHRQVLQDTADKIEPDKAKYDANTGFSSPPAPPSPQRVGQPGGKGSTHGFGRVNAFEAVRLVAPAADGGRGEVDLFLRDNPLDWGNTEQPSNVLDSVSIKIDAPPYEPEPPPTTPQAFADFPDEEPRAEATNKIYVLVRNRGRNAARNVTVKLAAGKLPDPLPPDFWGGAGSTITTSWALVDTRMISSVGYSGASIAMREPDDQQPGDLAQIATFDFDAPALSPGLAGFRDYSLLAVVDSPDDPVSDDSRASFAPDLIAPNDNNVTLRNVSLQDPPS